MQIFFLGGGGGGGGWGGGILTHFNKEGKVIFNMQQLAVTVAKKKNFTI